MKAPDTETDLALRGLVLDALTCLKSAHEELLQGNHDRAEVYLQKAGVIVAEARKQNAAVVSAIRK
jgi:hypothetical protein